MATTRTKAETTSKPDPFKTGGDISDDRIADLSKVLTEPQKAKVAKVASKSRARADGPEMGVQIKDGAVVITYAHAEPDLAAILLMGDLATCDPHFFAGVTGQIATIGAQGRKIDQGASNFLLSVVRAVQPRDELESLLAIQMGAIHTATMMMARRLNHVETIPQQDAAERALNKLARTYAVQMEALKRYRTGGQQKVTVEHVTVNAGGQAIVGTVAHGGGGQNGN